MPTESDHNFATVLEILEAHRQAMLSRPDQQAGNIYSRILDVPIRFRDMEINFELRDSDLEAITIPTKDGKRMFKKRVKDGWNNKIVIDYPAIASYERTIISDWPDFQDRVGELSRTYGPVVAPSLIEVIEIAEAIA